MRARRQWGLWCSTVLVATGAAPASLAQTPGKGSRSAPALRLAVPRSRAGLWLNGIGGEFREGARQAGYSLGAGFGIQVLGSERAHDLALGAARFGWILGGVGREDSWYHGNPELLIELYAGQQINSPRRPLYGLTPLLRYNFATGSRWMPFVTGGTGIAYTTIRRPDLSTDFEFSVQVGFGAHYFLSENRALTVQYRWFHLSNAGLKEPNNGTNTQMFYTGLDWFY